MHNTVALFLLTFKGYHVLKEYLNDFDAKTIELIVIGRDKNVKNDYSSAIKDLCIYNKIPYFFRNDKYIINSEYSIAVSWRWIISQSGKLIILHDSLLPKYRGFAPLVNALINGDSKIGVTALIANDEYDKGGIIAQEALEISYPIKIAEVIKAIAPLYYNVIKRILNNIFNEVLIETSAQNETLVSYSLWRDEDDYKIDWSKESNYIKRFIDAVGEPYSGAFSIIDGYKVRILDAATVNDVTIENRTPGKVIFIQNGQPIVVCGRGLLKITRMEDDNSKVSLIPFSKIRTRFN